MPTPTGPTFPFGQRPHGDRAIARLLTWYTAPENDYRKLLDWPVKPLMPTVCVVIPVFNRVALLKSTLAALEAQSYPPELLSVVVADDGSTEDVATAVEASQAGLHLELVRQHRDGYGAGTARNLGASTTGADVLVFIDADCIPGPELIERHVQWHRRADNVVIIGSRRQVDGSHLAEEDLKQGKVDLDGLSRPPDNDGRRNSLDDFRNLFYRRTSRLRLGDEAFRALVSSNFSVRRDRFHEVGAFSPDFARWGGEDTELGWRLFNAGIVFVPDDDAAIYHQTHEDGGTGPDWRADARRLNEGLLRTKIPHRFYREWRKGYIYEVPRVSWIVVPPVPRRAIELWEQLLRQTFTDFEVLFVVGSGELPDFAELVAADPRVAIINEENSTEEQFATAVHRARGEHLAIVHGWASLDPRLLGRAVRRLERRPRTGIVRCGYQVRTESGTQRHTSAADTESLDTTWGELGLPIFAVTRRRDWVKARHREDAPGEWWRHVNQLARVERLTDALVGMPTATPDDDLPDRFPAILSDRSALYDDVTHSGPAAATRSVGRYVASRLRRRPYSPAGATPARRKTKHSPSTRRPGVRYVGWLGKENLGDEAMFEATTRLMPWAEVTNTGDPTDLLLLGGGTLINRNIYLDWLRSKDSPRIERAVFGTGVASPDFWGMTEPAAGWADSLDTCTYVGVRGPQSLETLEKWRFRGKAEVVGDPALALEPPEGVDRRGGLVTLSPEWTKGELWGGEDGAVFRALTDLARTLLDEGREVALLSCFPGDDRYLLEMIRSLERPDLTYVAGYADIDDALRLLAASDVVVAERLHAAVLGAACGTPFVGLEHRPKIRDFAESVDQGQHVIRTDRIDAGELRARVADLMNDREQSAARLVACVAHHRTRQQAAAKRIRRELTAV